jgi:LysM repeat protein
MRSALRRKLQFVVPVFLIVIIVGCSTSELTPTQSPTATLLPYSLSSPTSTTELLIPTYSVIPSPGPTTTPFVHIVQKDDTMLGIAIRYGVTLEELLVANPDINPRILSIDQEIFIPSLEGDVPGGLIPTATPIPLQLAQVQCYPTTTLHSWCLTSVVNDGEEWLEGISAIITVFNSEGEQIDAQTTYAPLNLLPPGFVMPLGVMFPQSVDLAVATTNTSFVARTVEDRFVALIVDWELDTDSTNGSSVKVKVTLQVAGENEFGIEGASVLISALDLDGNVVGYRKAELKERLSIGESIELEIEVFSVGPLIDRVEVLAEAFPAVPVE